MATLPVKWYDNRFHGIPQMSGTPGAMIAILDAVLVNGFGNTNVVTVSVKDKIATIILQDGVKFFSYAVVAISGFSNQALNGEYKVLKSDTGRLDIKLDVPDGVIDSANVVVKYAPLGWIKPFSGVSRGIYKPNRVDALNWLLSVNDTAGQGAELCLCEDATSLDNLINTRPYNNTLRWVKSYYNNTTVFPFYFIGDPYCLYYKCPITNSSYDTNRNYGCVSFVGEGVRLSNVPDPFAVYITGQINKASPGSYHGDVFYNYPESYFVLRQASGLKIDSRVNITIRGSSYWEGFNNTNFYTDDDLIHLFTDNYFYSNDRRMTRIPGLVTSNTYRMYDNFDFFIDAKDNNLDRDLILSRSSYDNNSASTPNRVVFFDITGPWR